MRPARYTQASQVGKKTRTTNAEFPRKTHKNTPILTRERSKTRRRAIFFCQARDIGSDRFPNRCLVLRLKRSLMPWGDVVSSESVSFDKRRPSSAFANTGPMFTTEPVYRFTHETVHRSRMCRLDRFGISAPAVRAAHDCSAPASSPAARPRQCPGPVLFLGG